MPKSCAPVARVLSDNGYVTGGFGKWHLTPDNVQGAAGPFDRWPCGWGFDHWWGFLSGAAGQYDPIIVTDNSITGVPQNEDGSQYYFPDDITDKAVEWLHTVRAQSAEKPWFMYYSTGCAHAPHHVSTAWADKYKGVFDDGWDAYREKVFARQKELGIIPHDAELTPRPDLFPAWDSLNESEKKLYVRQMEVFAGYSENADWNVGRLLDSIEEMGDLDNTLIFYIWGDNGASMEGTITGSFNEMTFLNGVPLTPEQQLELIDKYGGIEGLGGVDSAPHYASAWAWAGNTPFQWGKQTGSHLGGTRDPMVVAWPERIKERGMRSQFTHCIDVGPTILEAAGIPEPKTVDGIEQEPMDGTSFLHTFDDADAEERHTVQYFESMGSRAIYKDGWWACARIDRVPWDFSPATIKKLAPGVYDPENDTLGALLPPGRLLAGPRPRRREAREARRAQGAVLGRGRAQQGAAAAGWHVDLLRHTAAAADRHPLRVLRRRPEHPARHGAARLRPFLGDRGRHLVPEGGAEGVLLGNGDEMGGFALWVDRSGMLTFTYSMLGVEEYKTVGDRAAAGRRATSRRWCSTPTSPSRAQAAR